MRSLSVRLAAVLAAYRKDVPREGAAELPRGATINLGIKARKRKIPSKRKARVRLRAFLTGRLHGRPLTAHERSWL